MSELERAAYAYVNARRRLREADTAGLLEWVMEVDGAWHALHRAAGLEEFDGCCDGEHEELLAPSTETVRTPGEVL